MGYVQVLNLSSMYLTTVALPYIIQDLESICTMKPLYIQDASSMNPSVTYSIYQPGFKLSRCFVSRKTL